MVVGGEGAAASPAPSKANDLGAQCTLYLLPVLTNVSRNLTLYSQNYYKIQLSGSIIIMSTSPRGSASPAPGAGPRHALSAVEKQRAQLDRLLKNPEKPAYVPPPPKEKTLRAPREMMKNVQGSSAGAGSGEFHVYKASRRREYERLKMMEDEAASVCF